MSRKRSNFEILPGIARAFGALTIASLIGCAAQNGYDANQVDPFYRVGGTGFIDDSGREFSIVGDRRLIMPDSDFPSLDKPTVRRFQPGPDFSEDLAQSIYEIKWQKSAKGRALIIKLEDPITKSRSTLTFEPKTSDGVSMGANVLSVGSATAKEDPRFAIEGTWAKPTKKEPALGELTLSKMGPKRDGPSTPVRVPIFTRSYVGSTAFTPAAGAELSRELQKTLQAYEKSPPVSQVMTTTIPKGRSWTEAKVRHGGQVILSLSGEATRTGSEILTEEKVQGSANLPAVSARRIGDAETSDLQTHEIRVKDRGPKGGRDEAVPIAVTVRGLPPRESRYAPGPVSKPSPKDFAKSLSSGFFATNVDPNGGSDIAIMFNHFNANFGIDGVQYWISKLTGKDSREATERFQNMTSARLKMIKVFEAYQVLPSAVSVNIPESEFFGRSGFRTHDVNKLSTALGPFQILVKSGPEYGLRVDPTQKIGELPRNKAIDERLYFAPSLCGAANHLRQSYLAFKGRDSTLAILAYMTGNQGVANEINRTLNPRTYRKNRLSLDVLFKNYPNLTYAAIAEQKMVPLDRLRYVDEILAYHFISLDPAAYGIRIDFNKTQPIPEDRLYPPDSNGVPSPDTIYSAKCRAVIKSVTGHQSPKI